ncbi:MAG: SDR family oxidoreductase [Tatlockia sp.]|nr:SDR family oxidoreductase [Tatlockia sp.]
MSKTKQPPQHQNKQPGSEEKMHPEPVFLDPDYKGSGKLAGKVALITGGDSGIGRAVACLFAQEGADIFIHYLDEHEDANKTKEIIEKFGQKCWLNHGDLKEFRECEKLTKIALDKAGHIDILINNIAVQYPKDSIEEISCEQMEKTFQTNFFSYFYMIKTVLPHLKKGDAIINTTSVTAYKGSDHLIDYASSKGAIVALTRSLSQNLVKKGIRVNAVAPGPVWTPLIPSTFSAKEVSEFGEQVPMERAGQPVEIAPAYLFLATQDSSYMTGQVLHPNGGVIINS